MKCVHAIRFETRPIDPADIAPRVMNALTVDIANIVGTDIPIVAGRIFAKGAGFKTHGVRRHIRSTRTRANPQRYHGKKNPGRSSDRRHHHPRILVATHWETHFLCVSAPGAIIGL